VDCIGSELLDGSRLVNGKWGKTMISKAQALLKGD